MNKIKYLVPFLVVILFSLSSCSSDDDSPNTAKFPMTAKINGELYEMTSPFGNNEDSARIFGYSYNQNDNDYIILQGRSSIDFNALDKEINIFISRNDLKVGTYIVGVDTDDETTHIDLIDLTNSETDHTIGGSITITDVDTANKTVQGTFQFDSAGESDVNATVHSVITEGTFNYVYDTK